MTLRAERSKVSRSAIPWRSAIALLLAALASSAQAQTLPPRSQWQASSSSQQVPAMAIGHLIDGDPKTVTGGAFSPGHWFQIDLGAPTLLAGARLTWDVSNPEGYSLQTSLDGTQWQTAYTMADSLGDVETLYFAPRQARYLRLASPQRTSDWGVSIFEMEPLDSTLSARISGIDAAQAAALWQGGGTVPMPAGTNGSHALEITLPQTQSTAGLVVDWADGNRGPARLQVQDAQGRWHDLAHDAQAASHRQSWLAANAAQAVRAFRLSVDGSAPKVARLRLLGPKAVMTPMKQYQIVASGAQRALFPASLQMQQTYWTAVGVHAGRQKSIFDEYGNLEAFKGAPLVQPIWRSADGSTAGAAGQNVQHALRDGWKPMPSATWSPQPGLELRSEVFAIERNGQPVTFLRHRLRNTGGTRIDGTLSLVVRPMQMNPPWQNGGLSPIRDVAIDGQAVRINGRTLLQSLTPVTASGAAPFGREGATEITAILAAGQLPSTQQARDDQGLAAAALNYRVSLAPGASDAIVVAFPLGTAAADSKGALPEAPALDLATLPRDANTAFDSLATQASADWQARLGQVGLRLPDPSLVDMLRAQAAYMLINQTGPAMQPGPRNYNRSFIRDGMATSAVLLRMGEARVARDYLAWYSEHGVHANGLVSPILNDDGSVNTGFGSDIEYDSQGQYVALVADVARLDGGPESVRAYLPKVKAALQFLQELRERTLVPGYKADQPAPERFAGILAPSISHEGYPSPTHSYWDDYWGLKGWHDGAWLAEALGDHETAAWAREQYKLLYDALHASIRATMAWKGIDFIPSSADLGDGDPTGVSIALDPTGAQSVLPAEALRTTFARYLEDVRKRRQPDALYAYTPYEIRNVLSHVHLGQPQVADELLQGLLHDRRPLEWQVLAEVVHSRLRFPRYLGDMPHTWIGAEYGRTLFGMLMREDDDALSLLPGTPPSWVAGDGLAVERLPTAYGTLQMQARQRDGMLTVTLGKGLRSGTAVKVWWPARTMPKTVRVDGHSVSDFDAEGVRLAKPFKTLEARW
ncbi:discoidin domain-containing protein [Stenotrophomonas maltophilia]|uniref:discoidin domain-containing protein n=1 Tax=Stenotrophomonas maltophilia TaxID=40324 RepID=UPI00066CF53A|nr:discoidin domain-containing protein [Stenotrophomonas maltophilia]ELK2666401.1 discoidin domain-containing protein [Stenotrophomonas maltophilia]ELK2669281.1 discoidin domain-containing protein [Stenotrophomonas maltophilia]ELK2669297.1 discoidin domain-containing protein [Stenotrophomonas maltophilia]MBH1377944.1 discoidin domain-containing protein [Stenotrophomonas maltophilia]MBH1440637.1 discoidin domain-containing protein [Stenotrophomonas maltophilia]